MFENGKDYILLPHQDPACPTIAGKMILTVRPKIIKDDSFDCIEPPCARLRQENRERKRVIPK